MRFNHGVFVRILRKEDCQLLLLSLGDEDPKLSVIILAPERVKENSRERFIMPGSSYS
jgi:hypothetical protein